MTSKLKVNIVSESTISIQGHGVHTAYEEMCHSLEARDDVEVVRGEFKTEIDCDIVHLHTIGTRLWGKILQDGPKKVVSAHVVPDSFVGSLVGAQFWRPLAVAYLRWFYNKADLLLAVSPQTARELAKLKVKAPIEVLYNSIDTGRYRPTAGSVKSRQQLRKQLGIKKDSFVVIGAGQVQPRKRVDLFVKAAKALPEITFVWVGGIPFGRAAADHKDMKKLMKQKLPNLVFTDIVPLENMPKYYQMADLFWLPSEQETFGLVVVEAAAAGLPILLRRSDDYNGTFGDDAHYGDDDSFVEDIKAIMSDKKLYSEFKIGAQAITDRFDSVKLTERLVELYRQLLA